MELYKRHTHLYSSEAKRGLLNVRNLLTGRMLLIKSEDFTKDIQSIRFQLDLGSYPHDHLQKEYDHLGLELFTIEIYKEVSDSHRDLQEVLESERISLHHNNTLLY